MIRRNRKTRNYQAPTAKVTQMALENNFCVESVRFNVRVQELDNINAKQSGDDGYEGPMYFEF